MTANPSTGNRKKRLLDGREAEVYELMIQGTSLSKAAKTLKVHPSTLRSFLRSHGVAYRKLYMGGGVMWGLKHLKAFIDASD